MAVRGGRVSKEVEGMRIFRIAMKYMEMWAKKKNVYRKVTIVSENQLADVTKPSFTKFNKHILTKVIFFISVA